MPSISKLRGQTYRFGHVLGEVGNIEVSRGLIAFRLEARVEGLLSRDKCQPLQSIWTTYPGESNLIAQLVEPTDAELRVTNMVVFGKAKA
jgi:hypothetical protein